MPLAFSPGEAGGVICVSFAGIFFEVDAADADDLLALVGQDGQLAVTAGEFILGDLVSL